MPAFSESHLEHLRAAMEDTLENTPFYRTWRERDPGPAWTPLERFRALPTLSRRDLRTRFPKGFVPGSKDIKAALDRGEVELVATSGTTEDRVQVIWWQPWWDRQEDAQYRLGHPLTGEIWRADFREAVLTTPVCSSGVCHIGDMKMEERIHQRMLFLNQKADPVHWSERDLVRMTDELNHYRPAALEADPAYLAALSRFIEARGVTVHQPRYIGLTYEFISRLHRKAIARAFPGVPIINSYGSTEAGCLHMNCERGALHANLDWTHVDILPLKPEHGGPHTGRVCATVLQNPWLKLLRYETGDLARLTDEPCPCGRAGETLAVIEGRLKDATLRPDGTLVTVERVDSSLGEVDDLEAYQVTQEGARAYLVRYIPRGEHDAQVQDGLRAAMRRVYGEADVSLQRETAINPEPSGKYRLARSTVEVDAARLFAST